MAAPIKVIAGKVGKQVIKSGKSVIFTAAKAAAKDVPLLKNGIQVAEKHVNDKLAGKEKAATEQEHAKVNGIQSKITKANDEIARAENDKLKAKLDLERTLDEISLYYAQIRVAFMGTGVDPFSSSVAYQANSTIRSEFSHITFISTKFYFIRNGIANFDKTNADIRKFVNDLNKYSKNYLSAKNDAQSSRMDKATQERELNRILNSR